MQKRHLLLVSGALLTVGAIAALAAPPRGAQDGMWGQPGMGMRGMDMRRQGGGPDRQGMRGWSEPRSITADEYDARTRERFARMDKNSDGVIDTAEIEAAMTERGQRRRGGGQGARQGGAGERILRQFGDKDGKIVKDAFLTEAKRRFAQLDLTNDGKITDDDLPPTMRGKGVLKAGGPVMPGPRGQHLTHLRAADLKGDGVITLDAFVAMETKRFEELDRNKDGVVDKSDFEAVRKDMTAYGIKRFLHAYGADADGKVTKDQYFKVAKERFARLDRKGEGRITFGDRDGERRPMGPDRGPPPPPPLPKQ